MNGNVLSTINLLEEMAKEAGSSVEKAISMVKVYERRREAANADRRSTPTEKDLVRDALAKLDASLLRNSDSKDIADRLARDGLAIRPHVQGVLSVISRTRKQLLLTYDRQQPAAA
jgi:hypothetical protein